MKRATRGLGIIGTAFVVVLIASPAFAHATYKSSNPDDESTVSSSPSQITAEFTEPMVDGSYMDVTDPCGRDTGTGSSQTGSSMGVQNTSSASGTYVVFWRAVSVDGHITEGEFTFTSTGGDPCPGEEKESSGGGGTGGSTGSGGRTGSSGAGSSSGSGGSTTVTDGGSASNDGSGHKAGHSNHRGGGADGGGGGTKNRASGQGGPDGIAQGPGPTVPDPPSALEGISMSGLMLTLAVAALIGAAAGKVYVSLSADDS